MVLPFLTLGLVGAKIINTQEFDEGRRFMEPCVLFA